MFKELKVFDAMYEGILYDNWIPVYACRGAACDKLRGRSKRETQKVVKSRLFVPDGVELRDGEYVYRYVSKTGCGPKATSWYLSDEEAMEAARRLRLMDGDRCFLQHGELNMEQIKPLERGQKLTVYFKLDDKGRPFARINAHPERDGILNKGKIFFPSRSFVGADQGEALVSIEKEFDTYGFLSGEMVKFGMPDMERFLDWAWEKSEEIGFHEVLYIDHPGRGKYLAINSGDSVRRIMEGKDWKGNMCIQFGCAEDDVAQADAGRYLVRRKHLDELFLESAWKTEVNLDALEAKFVRSRLFESPLTVADWEESCKFHGELFDSAVQREIFSQYVSLSLHIEAVTFNCRNVAQLGNYSQDEVEELAKTMWRINQAADQAGLAKVKKGLLLPF